MKKALMIVAILVIVIGRAMWVEENNPQQWGILWSNYKDTESIGKLFSESVAVLRGQEVKRVAMSIREQNTVVYQWIDERGKAHMSYQKPRDVVNVKEIRLGDLDYKIEKSLTAEDIVNQLTKEQQFQEEKAKEKELKNKTMEDNPLD